MNKLVINQDDQILLARNKLIIMMNIIYKYLVLNNFLMTVCFASFFNIKRKIIFLFRFFFIFLFVLMINWLESNFRWFLKCLDDEVYTYVYLKLSHALVFISSKSTQKIGGGGEEEKRRKKKNEPSEKCYIAQVHYTIHTLLPSFLFFFISIDQPTE